MTITAETYLFNFIKLFHAVVCCGVRVIMGQNIRFIRISLNQTSSDAVCIKTRSSINFNQYQENQYVVLLLLKYQIFYHLSLLEKLKVQEAFGAF